MSLIGRRVANLPPSNLHAQGYPTQACSIDPSLHSRGYSRATATTEQLNVRPPRPSVRNRAERKPDFIILGHPITTSNHLRPTELDTDTRDTRRTSFSQRASGAACESLELSHSTSQMKASRDGGGPSKMSPAVQSRLATMRKQQERWMKDREQVKQQTGCTGSVRTPSSNSAALSPAPGMGAFPQAMVRQSASGSAGTVGHVAPIVGLASDADLAARLKDATDRALEEESAAERSRNLEFRINMLEEEVIELGEDLNDGRRALVAEQAKHADVDDEAAEIEAEVARFMQAIKERRHALACQRATVDERCRKLELQNSSFEEKINITRSTVGSLQRDLS